MSLSTASTAISNKSSPIDGQLFLIKHLLILKQQIVAFDIEFVTPDISIDFSGVTSTFWELRERGGLFNPRNLMRLVGHGLFPRVVENMLDAKVELDGRLRTVINEFTQGVATKMTSSLPNPAYPSGANKTPPSTTDLTAPTRATIEKEVPSLRHKLDLYLQDVRTKETLVNAVQDRVIQIYEEFFEKYAVAGGQNGKPVVVSKKGKGRQDAVWDGDTFAEWCVETFAVGRAAGYYNDDNASNNDDDDDDDDTDGISVGVSRNGSRI